MPRITDEVLNTYVDEASDRLDDMEYGLLRLEHGMDADQVNAVFRDAHSIKAGANLLGLGNIERVAHRMENILDGLRKDAMPLGDDVVQSLLTAIDVLKELVGNVEASEELDVSPLVRELSALAERAG